MSTMTVNPVLDERGLEALRRAGNPFRNYFARNPDDDVCARYHVPELYARERQQLLGVVDLYRYDPTTHSEVVPVLGNKGAGKTHLLHSIKHGKECGWQLLGHAGHVSEGQRFSRVPAVPDHRHAARRRRAAGRPAAGIRQRQPDATAPANGAAKLRPRPANGTVPRGRCCTLGAKARPRRKPDSGTDPMADRQSGPAFEHLPRRRRAADLRRVPARTCSRL